MFTGLVTDFCTSVGAQAIVKGLRASSDFDYELPMAHMNSALTGVASLQCLRCANEAFVSRLLCQERARLEYCQRREGLEPQCPSAIPVSPPG